MKQFLYFLILVGLASCSQFTGERSLGKNITVIEGKGENDRTIFYCPNKDKPCEEGLKLIANIDDLRSNEDWIVARTIKGNQESYWIINKDFALGDKDCGKEDCGDYIKTFVSGPLTLEDFNGHTKELKITLYLPPKK